MGQTTPPETQNASAHRAAFIAAMRSVAASVTVVTTDGPGGRQGATVSAFTSVSADPPTVLVCLRQGSRIAQAVDQNARFCVNVLPQGNQAIANRFAGLDDARISDRFSGIECYGDPGTPPALDGATVFSCEVAQTSLVGSHLVVMGTVQMVRAGHGAPLTYLDGAYHRVVPHDVPRAKAV